FGLCNITIFLKCLFPDNTPENLKNRNRPGRRVFAYNNPPERMKCKRGIRFPVEFTGYKPSQSQAENDDPQKNRTVNHCKCRRKTSQENKSQHNKRNSGKQEIECHREQTQPKLFFTNGVEDRESGCCQIVQEQVKVCTG